MEPERITPSVESLDKFESLKKVTPLSKYLAMMLFIIMPFIGGWIGYTYAPEKVVEVEKVVVNDKIINNDYETEFTDTSPTDLPDTAVSNEREVNIEMYSATSSEAFNALFTKYDNYSIKPGRFFEENDYLVLYGFDGTGSSHAIAYVEQVATSSAGLLYFTIVRPYTDASQVLSLVYDPIKDEVRKLKIVPQYHDLWIFDRQRVSPDGLHMLSIANHEENLVNAHSLYLLNLTTDTVRTLTVLPDNETFIKSIESFASTPVADIRWVDNSTIEASIFDANTLVKATFEDEHPFVRKQVFSIIE